MRKLVVLFVFLLNTLCVCAAESRLALLIANGTYKNFSSLATPVKEARDLKKSLETLGFSVVIVENASREKMSDALYDFQKRLEKSGGIGFFHYGGHAVQVSGKNYLIPSDADIPDERRIASRALDCDEIMASMQANVNIVVLDSCRNNPLSSGSGRSASRGLVLTEMKPKNSIIVYSAQAGKTAQDGVFTPILTQKILEKKSFTEVLMDVRKEVRARTAGEQSPGEYNELEEAVYLAGQQAEQAQPVLYKTEEVKKETVQVVEEKKSLTKQPSAEKQSSTAENQPWAVFGSWYSAQARKAIDEGNYWLALDYLKKDKSAEGYYLQGVMYELGVGGLKQSNSKAVSLYKKALDYPPALYKMGIHQTYKDWAKAAEYFTKAAYQDEPRALFALSVRTGGAKGLEYLERAAALGYEFASFKLGECYQNGTGGVAKDIDKAYEWYAKATADTLIYATSSIERAWGIQWLSNVSAEYQHYMALEKAGDCCLGGSMPNATLARSYYQKAAAEITDANWLFNTAYKAITAEPLNYAKGFEYNLRSAELGNADAMGNVGWAYRYGYGVESDFAKAVEWYGKGADAGNAYSQYNYGSMVANGLGVQKDMAIAIEWWKLAAKQGNTDAQKALTNQGESW